MKAIAIAILGLMPACLWAQPSGGIVRMGSASGGPAPTFTTENLRIQTLAEPASSPLAHRFSTSFNSTGNFQGHPSFLSRRLVDHADHLYLGYEVLLVEQQPGTYLATFGKLGITPLEMSANLVGWVSSGVANGSVLPANASSIEWTTQDLPAIPSPQLVRDGETMKILLIEDPVAGEKLYDIIEIHPQARPVILRGFNMLNSGQPARPARQVPAVSGPARDYSVGDVELRITQPRITLNGDPATSSALCPSRGASGSLVWIYLPGKGRYILSLAPRPELHFVKAGEVRGGSASFTVGGDTILIECSNEIVPARSAYNLYVLADPQWEPTSAVQKTQVEMGSVDPGELAKLQ